MIKGLLDARLFAFETSTYMQGDGTVEVQCLYGVANLKLIKPQHIQGLRLLYLGLIGSRLDQPRCIRL